MYVDLCIYVCMFIHMLKMSKVHVQYTVYGNYSNKINSKHVKHVKSVFFYVLLFNTGLMKQNLPRGGVYKPPTLP